MDSQDSRRNSRSRVQQFKDTKRPFSGRTPYQIDLEDYLRGKKSLAQFRNHYDPQDVSAHNSVATYHSQSPNQSPSASVEKNDAKSSSQRDEAEAEK